MGLTGWFDNGRMTLDKAKALKEGLEQLLTETQTKRFMLEKARGRIEAEKDEIVAKEADGKKKYDEVMASIDNRLDELKSEEGKRANEIDAAEKLIHQLEWVVLQHYKLLTHEPDPKQVPDFTAPTITVVADLSVEKGLTQEGAALLLQLCHDAAQAEVDEVRTGLDARFKKILEQDGTQEERQTRFDEFMGALENQKEDIQNKAVAALEQEAKAWAEATGGNLKFKLNAAASIASASLKLGFAITRAVLSMGADPTAYYSAGKAVIAIVLQIKGLLQDTEKAWKEVQEHIDTMAKLGEKSELEQGVRAAASEMLPILEGSIGKLQDAIKVHQAKAGGSANTATDTIAKLAKLLDRQDKGEGNQELWDATQAALTAAQEASEFATVHLRANRAAQQWAVAYEQAHTDSANVTKVFRVTDEIKRIVAGVPQAPVGTLDDAKKKLDEAVGKLEAAKKATEDDAEGAAKS